MTFSSTERFPKGHGRSKAAGIVRVIGIDPGTLHLGWGVVEHQGQKLTHVASGILDMKSETPLALRLLDIERGLSAVLEEYTPTAASVETLFFHKDAQAAAKLGHARGVVLFVLAKHQVPISEYQPARVKRTLTGRGHAEKEQVAMMVRAVLGLATIPGTDATDALALAITHSRVGGFEAALRRATTAPSHPAAVLLEAERRVKRARAAARKR